MMGDVNEFSFVVRTFVNNYPWRVVDPTPWQAVKKTVQQSRVALVSTAGMVPPGAPHFDKVRGGDTSFRVVPGDLEVSKLVDEHRSDSFDHAGIASDRNLAFPLDRLRELAAAGEIGEVAPRHLSFMGSITAPGRLIKNSAPEAARLLADDQVDLALLVPV